NNSGITMNLSRNNLIGGTNSGAGNVISGNGNGIEIYGPAINGYYPPSLGLLSNSIFGNFIGTDPTGTLDRGNSYAGVFIEWANGNTIGDTIGGGNVIAYNDYGVILSSVTSPDKPLTNNAIRGNSIFNNKNLGIFAASVGSGKIDRLDADGVQNFPVLYTAAPSGGDTLVQAMLNGRASSSYEIDW